MSPIIHRISNKAPNTHKLRTQSVQITNYQLPIHEYTNMPIYQHLHSTKGTHKGSPYEYAQITHAKRANYQLPITNYPIYKVPHA
jgi:hypothetical protein